MPPARLRSSSLLVLALAVLVSAAMPAGAPAAAPIRECGNMPSRLAYNLTTRVATCKKARRVVRSWGNGPARNGSGDGYARGLYCNYSDTGYEAGDIRCTGSRGRVVHWQTSS